MEPEVVLSFLGLGVCVVGSAWFATRLWLGGERALPVALLIALLIIAALLYAIGEGTPGFLGGLGWILAAMFLAAGPGAGLLIGILLGAVLARRSRPSPSSLPNDKAAP